MYRRRILITKGLHKKIVDYFLCVKPGQATWFIKQSNSCVLQHKIWNYIQLVPQISFLQYSLETGGGILKLGWIYPRYIEPMLIIPGVYWMGVYRGYTGWGVYWGYTGWGYTGGILDGGYTGWGYTGWGVYWMGGILDGGYTGWGVYWMGGILGGMLD